MVLFNSVCGHLVLSCDGKVCQNTEAQPRQRRYTCRWESAGACGIPTFALDLHFLLNASAVQLSNEISPFLTQDTGSMNFACNQIFFFSTNLVPSASRMQGTTDRYFLIKTHYRQHIDHLYISGCVHYLFYVISNDICSFYKATLIILLKSLLSIDYITK